MTVDDPVDGRRPVASGPVVGPGAAGTSGGGGPTDRAAEPEDTPYGLAGAVIREATARGVTLATAESLTGGLVAAALTGVPGASVVFRGGVVSYASAVKAEVLGVSARLLAERGAVDPDVASAMAAGVARLVGADLAVATTGVAGPDPADGKPVGRVYVAVSDPPQVRRLDLVGDRASIRAASVEAALDLVLAALVTRPT